MQNQHHALVVVHALQRLLTVRRQHRLMGDALVVHESIKSLEVFGMPQFVRERSAGVAGNLVRELNETTIASPIAQVGVAEMTGTERSCSGRGGVHSTFLHANPIPAQ